MSEKHHKPIYNFPMNITKYLDAFPFSHTYISKGSNFLFFLENNKTLKVLDLNTSLEHSSSITISHEDFSKRSFQALSFDEVSSLLYFESDEDNKENYNIYSIDIKTSEIKKITNTKYCGTLGFNADHSSLVFGDRYKTENGLFFTKIFHLDLKNNKTSLIVDDYDWEYRFSWSNVLFSNDNEHIYICVDKDNQRKKYNVIQIDLKTKEFKKLIPSQYESAHCYPLDIGLNKTNLNFFSECSGFDNLYLLDIEHNETTQITNFNDSINGLHCDIDNNCVYLIFDQPNLNKTKLLKLSLNNADAIIQSEFLNGSHNTFNSDDLWLVESNIDLPPNLNKYEFNKELLLRKTINNFRGKSEELINNTYEFIEYESFDKKKVPAYISIPKGEIKGAMIKAFYGGKNFYSWQMQLYSELGFIILSPGVRGSWDYGQEWRDYIKGDLGGNEILDLHWGAKYLKNRFKLKDTQIGLEGGSHGGYAVLRGLTMPEGFNRSDSTFNYGFGVCWAGFADLEDFYKSSNIPDWLVDMLGPYEENKVKYQDRSPVHHFENLKAPLFIAHGSNDQRVPSSTMEQFLEKLKNSDKQYTIHMMKDLGHGAGDRTEEFDMYNKVVIFLQQQLSRNL